MNGITRASISALAVQPFAFLGYAGLHHILSGNSLRPGDLLTVEVLLASLAFAFVVIVYAAGHLIVLGLPLFLLLRRTQCVCWTSAALGGFVYGGLPTAIFAWPVIASLGWTEYLASIMLFGGQGLIGALAFYRTWQAHAHR